MAKTMQSDFDWLAYDRRHLWHPYSSMTDPATPFLVSSASGVYLTLADGRQLIDGMSSWWAAIHGYNQPRLNRAINGQLQQMAHVMFGGLTHQPAIALAHRLIELTAEPLQKVFFADSGSVAVEVAMKMALQYWYLQGRRKKQHFLTVRNGYHGDTFGAMSVCDPVNGMHQMFSGVLPQHYFAEAPPCRDNPEQLQSAIADFERLAAEHHSEIAAVILEPIVQGAGGMRIHPPEYLQRIKQICETYDLLLILDEIATGFGRTGTLFAYQQADIVPDILLLGKALTGGYMTLAATLTTRTVAEGVSADNQSVLMHGPTFMANPLACSVALESINLLLDTPWQQRVQAIEQQLIEQLAICQTLPVTADVRVKGAIGVVELKQPVDLRRIQPRLVELGVWIRPFGRLLYLMPPYIIKPDELSRLTAAIYTVVEERR